jgi:hypothetical protein
VEDTWAEKLAIQELCARYCQAIDSQDAEGWARCFTPEGTFEVEGWAIQGHEALQQYAMLHSQIMRCRHLTMNFLYDVHGHEATGRSTTIVTLATEGGYKLLGQGVYEDRMLKHHGQWQIAYRRVHADRLAADPQREVYLADPDVAALVQHLTAAAQRLGRRIGQ